MANFHKEDSYKWTAWGYGEMCMIKHEMDTITMKKWMFQWQKQK